MNISLPDQAQKTPEHLARHPLGKVPALEDGDVTVWDSQAILVYFAQKYVSGGTLFPTDPVGQAHVTLWLFFAAKEMWERPATAQAIPTFNRPGDIVAAQDLARAAIQIVEDRLDLDWLVGDGATIADIVVYTYVGLIWEGQVELTSYPNVIACMRRIEDRTMLAWMVWRIKPKRRTYAAS